MSSFLALEWCDVNVQLFEEYVGHYAELITEKQFARFREQENLSESSPVYRIYKLWGELVFENKLTH
ncbi:hypothetical protein [Colwellia echini]|uniref:Uncharacterized protein n=1 Tax=Colwellia echini TaxID=1982103 RepID=A0ABY3N011_9GAMM|nr:hypothetical protein [Colwellia echini]TYK66825.1 hypothetical protein CWS31_003315 [Colwellia echini]